MDLLALAELIATLRDWLVICHRRVPVVFRRGQLLVERGRLGGWRVASTWRFGVSIPAVTMRLEITKQDIRNGRSTGLPVSEGRSASSMAAW